MPRLDPLDEDMGQTPSQTSDVEEQGFVDRKKDEDFGHAEVDPASEGDIADEGGAHRG